MISPKQTDFFLNSGHDINFAVGSVSGGKTYTANLTWSDYVYNRAPENSQLVMTGRTLGSLYNNCVKFMIDNDDFGDLKPIYANGGGVSRLKVKSKNIDIVCMGADNVSSWKGNQGITHAGSYSDEVSLQPKLLLQGIVKGARQGGRDWPNIWTSNPDVPKHFLRSQFMLNPELDIRTWNFTLDDNPSLTDAYRKKVRALYSGAMYDRFILGKWVAGVDATIFHTWDRKRNLVDKPIEYDPGAEVLTMWDFGVADPTAIIVVQIKQIPGAPNGMLIEVIDTYQNRNQDHNHYKGWCQSRPWFSNYKLRHAGDPSSISRTHALTSWITGLAPEIEMNVPTKYSVRDFSFNANLYMESVRACETQSPLFVEMVENWGYPTGQDDLPLPGAKPLHDDYSHLGTAWYYGLGYRFPIIDTFQIEM